MDGFTVCFKNIPWTFKVQPLLDKTTNPPNKFSPPEIPPTHPNLEAYLPRNVLSLVEVFYPGICDQYLSRPVGEAL